MIQRDYYLSKLIARKDNGRIKIITGIRRCGKSVLLFELYKNYLLKSGITEEQIITLKLDLGINARYRNPMELDKYVREHITNNSKRYYVLLDEIQEVKSMQNPWLEDKNERIGFVDILLGLMDIPNADIYVTGSNSKMLSTDIMTEFKDRGDEIHVNPLFYKEFRSAYNGDNTQAWQEFITFGGLPRVQAEPTVQDKSNYLQALIHKTYLTDVVERNNILKDISVLDDLLNVVASCVGALTNPSKLERTFASVKQTKVDNATISIYLDHFVNAYILRKSLQYNIKGKSYINTPLKYYFTDIGLRNAHLNFRQQEETHIMENVIFNELCGRGLNVDVGVVEFNYKDEQGTSKRSRTEVDFVVNKGHQRYYIQSAFAIPNEEKRRQETISLLRIKDAFSKIVVVRDNIIPWHDENGIYYIGVERFLLDYIDEVAK